MAQISEGKPRFVALSNLPPTAVKEDIQRFIDSEATQFNLGKLHQDESTLQSCEVELFNDRDLRGVLALNGKIFMGYEVTVEQLEAQENPLEVFIRKIPIHVTEADIRGLFCQFGKIEEVTLPRWHDTGKPRGFGFIRFADKEHARKAVQSDGKLRLHGMRLSIRPNLRFVAPTKQQRKTSTERISKRMTERPHKCTTIYVGNVDFEASDEQISKLFSNCGTVLNVRIVRQQFTNRSRGFAYIEFLDEESVTKAVAMDGQDFLGRKIRVDFAEPFDPTRSANKNFVTFTPRDPPAQNERYLSMSDYLPAPSTFIMDHFADNPFAGLAALAGAGFINEQQTQQAPQLPQQPHFIPATSPFCPPMMPASNPNCSVPLVSPSFNFPQPNLPMAPTPQTVSPMPPMPYFPNFFVPQTQTVYNSAQAADPIQLDATLFTQGIPGIGHFLAPYALLTQRAMVNQASMQAKPPAQAPVATQQARPRLPFSQRCFSPQDISSAQNTATTQRMTSSQQAYRICSDSVDVDGEPWESHDVNNAVLY